MDVLQNEFNSFSPTDFLQIAILLPPFALQSRMNDNSSKNQRLLHYQMDRNELLRADHLSPTSGAICDQTSGQTGYQDLSTDTHQLTVGKVVQILQHLKIKLFFSKKNSRMLEIDHFCSVLKINFQVHFFKRPPFKD